MQTIEAKTFTVFYDEQEDRLRLVVNYQDFEKRYDFMITRAFTIKIIPSLEKFILDNIDIEEDKVYSRASYNRKTDNSDLILYKKREGLLKGLNISHLKNKQKVVLNLKSNDIVVKSVISEK